jgi:hypothetical protein
MSSLSSPIWVQPPGGVVAEFPFKVTMSSSVSPACTADGTLILAAPPFELAELLARRPIDEAGAALTVTEWVTESVAPESSVTVSVTG